MHIYIYIYFPFITWKTRPVLVYMEVIVNALRVMILCVLAVRAAGYLSVHVYLRAGENQRAVKS